MYVNKDNETMFEKLAQCVLTPDQEAIVARAQAELEERGRMRKHTLLSVRDVLKAHTRTPAFTKRAQLKDNSRVQAGAVAAVDAMWSTPIPPRPTASF